MDINELLDKVKEVCGARTDGELAKRLGVSKQALSSYRNGHRLPDTVQCATIAGLSGLPLAQVLGIVGEARAISRDEKAVWRQLAATATLLALVLLPGLPAAASVDQRAVKADPDCTLCEVLDDLHVTLRVTLPAWCPPPRNRPDDSQQIPSCRPTIARYSYRPRQVALMHRQQPRIRPVLLLLGGRLCRNAPRAAL
ncbi:helix-turn-helix transcriptional regulator [Luteimonas sp. BLCC-B24]|uniref:helix-turn-helix domain-containing protein n=1 Tax=Luteimonas sp. BLCC-B24 TaxID=3025317 RepID=UPI00234D3A03|nr:helix-turn-helix transcriptional regulator [Luteimonas sp. BLCC-B24]